MTSDGLPVRFPVLVLGGLIVAGMIGMRLSADPGLKVWIALITAAWCIPLAGLLPVWLMERAQHGEPPPASGGSARWGEREPATLDPAAVLAHAAGWPQAVEVIAAGGLALFLPWWFRPGFALSGGGPWAGLAAIALFFPVLVLERHLALAPAAPLRPTIRLSRLLRVPAVVLILAGTAFLVGTMGWSFGRWLQWPAALLVGLTGGELVLRGLWHLWMRPAAPTVCADSLVAGWLTWRGLPWRAVLDGLQRECGIDLHHSWSARLIGRALPATVASLAVLVWLTTGISVVPLGQRVVLETSGQVRVLGAGTHLHAPWPWSTGRRLEDGRVHQTPLSDTVGIPTWLGVEEDPPPECDRLWDGAHPGERLFLLPAPTSSSGRADHGFRILAGDIRVLWTIGPQAEDAIALTGRHVDAQVLVQRAARRAVVGCFARLPMEQVIAADRERLAGGLRQQVQSAVDELSGGRSGIQVAAIILDALHPPAGAATAYHRVQSAGIEAATVVAQGRAEAARLGAEAAIAAGAQRAAAQAGAREILAQATGEGLRFAAEERAWTAHRQAVSCERWLEALSTGLARRPVLLIDHRLPQPVAPVLDLRLPAQERRP